MLLVILLTFVVVTTVNSGGFAMFAAIRLASSLLSSFAAERRPGSFSK